MNDLTSLSNPGLSRKIVIIFIIMLVAGCSSFSSTGTWAEEKPKHHTQNGFRNYPVIPDPPPVGAAFYLRRVLGSFFLPDVPDDHYLSEKDAISQFQQLNGRNSITWLGHATFLIRINGMTILTDPFLTEFASPLWEFGPRRYVQPGISLDNLPPVDMVIVSHNHLDHLDAETVESLQGKERIHVFVPLGLKPFFKDRGYINVEELDWDESYSYSGIEFTALPAVHFSGRGLNDKNKTLWCSWSISSQSGKVFFSGDTSYSPTIFKTIGKEYGPYDLAIVSIGAYKTRKHGPASHLTPEEAVKVAMDTKSNLAVTMHWGTIELSDEPPWEPPVRFKKAAQNNGIASDQTWVMKIGETRLMPSKKD
ncbi:MAG: MBL fold metallo-hydrolase [Gammaproteobacteria bacterium]|nr:MBL fold metallo-hydrolase [Gammaproteobacteria bacterium]